MKVLVTDKLSHLLTSLLISTPLEASVKLALRFGEASI